MFVGMSKTFWGLWVSLFIDLKIASKKLHQNRLFDTNDCVFAGLKKFLQKSLYVQNIYNIIPVVDT